MCFPLAGAIISGIGSAISAAATAASYDAQAKQYDRQALIQREQGAYEADRAGDKAARSHGTLRAGIAANGLAFDGSATDLVSDSIADSKLDIEAIRWNTGRQVETTKYSAQIARMNASAAGAAIPFAFAAPVIQGAAQFRSAF